MMTPDLLTLVALALWGSIAYLLLLLVIAEDDMRLLNILGCLMWPLMVLWALVDAVNPGEVMRSVKRKRENRTNAHKPRTF